MHKLLICARDLFVGARELFICARDQGILCVRRGIHWRFPLGPMSSEDGSNIQQADRQPKTLMQSCKGRDDGKYRATSLDAPSPTVQPADEVPFQLPEVA